MALVYHGEQLCKEGEYVNKGQGCAVIRIPTDVSIGVWQQEIVDGIMEWIEKKQLCNEK